MRAALPLIFAAQAFVCFSPLTPLILLNPQEIATYVCEDITLSSRYDHISALLERDTVAKLCLLLNHLAVDFTPLDLVARKRVLLQSLRALSNLSLERRVAAEEIIRQGTIDAVQLLLWTQMPVVTDLDIHCTDLLTTVVQSAGTPLFSLTTVATFILQNCSSNEDLIYCALDILIELASGPRKNALFIATCDGVISSVMEYLNIFKTYHILLSALRFFSSVAVASSEICEMMMNDGLGELLVQLWGYHKPIIRTQAVSILNLLCLHPSIVSLCITRGILQDVLSYISNSSHEDESIAEAGETLINCWTHASTPAERRNIMSMPFFFTSLKVLLEQPVVSYTLPSQVLPSLDFGAQLGSFAESSIPDFDAENPILDYFHAQFYEMSETGALDPMVLPVFDQVFNSVGHQYSPSLDFQ